MIVMDEMKRSFDVVIFDLGGTLIFFDGVWPDVIAAQHLELGRALAASGYKLDVEAFAGQFMARLNDYYKERDTEFIEQTTEYILRTLLAEYGYENAPSSHLRPALDRMYAVTEAYWKAEDDAHATLQALLDQGYRLGLISNAKDARDVQILIDQSHLRPYFEIILISADLAVRKPHPRIFQSALDQLGVPPERAVMVGDTLGADVLGARNAGMASVWITRRASKPGNRDHDGTIQADAVIGTLSELPDLLECWPERKPNPEQES